MTPEKWHNLSKSDQILNIAAEFARAKYWLSKDDVDEVKNCLNRAFELIDLTIADSKWSRGLKELLRFRGLLAEFYIADNPSEHNFKQLFRALLNFDAQSALVKI